MAGSDRPKCPVCGALVGEGKWDAWRSLGKQAPIFGENPRRRAKATKIRKQNG